MKHSDDNDSDGRTLLLDKLFLVAALILLFVIVVISMCASLNRVADEPATQSSTN